MSAGVIAATVTPAVYLRLSNLPERTLKNNLIADIVTVSREIGRSHGSSFFTSAVRALSETTGCDIVFIANVDLDSNMAHTLALCADGEIAENFSYSLTDTPCSNVIRKNICVYPNSVTSLFPRDELLIGMGIEGYVGTPLYDSKGDVEGVLVALHRNTIDNHDDVLTLFEVASTMLAAEIERVHQVNEITRLNDYDSVTGLGSKAALLDRLAQPGSKSLLVASIDNLALINDAYGMREGDRIIAQTATFLRENIKADFYASIGPSKYALLFDGRVDLLPVSREIQSFFLENEVRSEKVSVHLSFSFGGATGNRKLLIPATSALRSARAAGVHHQLAFSYDESEEDFFLQQHAIEASNIFQQALKHNLIVPYFQGVRHNITGETHKYEALARIHYDGEILSPAKFLHAAHVTGRLPGLTKQMICNSFRIMSKHSHSFSINVAESDLNQNYLLDYLLEQTAEHDMDPGRVTLEILEEISSSSKDLHLQQLRSFKDAGFKLSIDDFGSEHSSFHRILDLEVDYIKIDAKYIRNIHRDQRSREIVRAISFFCQNVGIHSIAENVDSEEAFECVRDLGITYSQGFLFSKPEPFESE